MRIPDIDFPPVSSDEWKEMIIRDLRGKPFEELVSKNKDGIEIQPTYHSDTAIPDAISQTLHRVQPQNDNWRLNRVYREDEVEIDAWMERAKNEGIKSIEFEDPTTFSKLPSSIKPIEQVRIHLREDQNVLPSVLLLLNDSEFKSIGLYVNRLSKVEYSEVEPFVNRIYLVPASKYAEIGASATTELAIALSWAHEYLVEMLLNDVRPERAAELIEVQLASGTDYFTEIAKFRAIRVLWSVLTSKYEIENSDLHVSSINSKWYFTKNDDHNNLLRSTTQTMSAIIGGSQTLTVLPFNGTGDAFSERIAANVGNLLEHESYFRKLHDPSFGSYYLDNLTYQIVQLAWSRTIEIENAGGFSKAKNDGLIKKMYKDDADLETGKVLAGDKALLGVNKFPNPNARINRNISVESLERAYLETK